MRELEKTASKIFFLFPLILSSTGKILTVREIPYVLEKYFPEVSEAARDQRSKAASEAEGKYFSVRPSHPVNNIYMADKLLKRRDKSWIKSF
jgi:hypothetical protein